jgi:hypothetical protein
LGDGMKQRASAAQAERSAQMVYRQSKIDSEALDDGTTNLDLVINGGMVVVATFLASGTPPATPAGGSSPTGATPPSTTAASSTTGTPSGTPVGAPVPALSVTYTVAGATSDACYFFALPISDAPGFSYNDAKTAVIDLPMQSTVTGWTPTVGTRKKDDKPGPTQTYTATITISASVLNDATGKPTQAPLAVGQSYRVFAYRVPVEGPYATNANDLSYPSRTTQILNAIPNLAQYRAVLGPPPVAPVSDKPLPVRFSVQVSAPGDAATNLLEFRAFALLEDVYQAIKDDASFLTNLWPSSSYKRAAAAGSASFSYQEGDTDAYGDIITEKTNYEVLILLVPKDTDNMASSLLLAQPAAGQPATPSGTSGTSGTGPGGGGTPSSSASSTRTSSIAIKPAPDSSAVSAAQPAPAPGAK